MTTRTFAAGTRATRLYNAYHDEEWGRPVRDEQGLYERLCLEGFQSGLSWLTILRKREGFRKAFAGFDPDRVARFDEHDVERLLGDAGIVRHRGKIEAAIANARATVALRDSHAAAGAVLVASRRSTACARDAGRLAGVDARIDGAREGAAQGRFPLRRADDGVRGDAGLRRRQRPPGDVLGPRESSVLTALLWCRYPRKGGGPALETSSTGSGGTSS